MAEFERVTLPSEWWCRLHIEKTKEEGTVCKALYEHVDLVFKGRNSGYYLKKFSALAGEDEMLFG
jgi:hypothetical protein